MPFYPIDEIEKSSSKSDPKIEQRAVVGELMKAGIVTKPDGVGPPLHKQPNEEQFTFVLEGKLHYILGDEERIVEKGDLIHIPRGVPHRSRPVDGPARFFTVKSPAGAGGLNDDHHTAEGAEEAEARYPGKTN
jgi:quercetin dioxygenase-like cupin family protein